MKTPDPSKAPSIAFNSFWRMISRELGDARLMLNPNAKQISAFIHGNSDIQSYLHDTIRKSFKLSRCQNLSSPICFTSVFDLLGEAAYTLQQRDNCDLFDIELLEEVAWLISDRYARQVAEMVRLDAQRAAPNSFLSINPETKPEAQPKASVVSFPRFKIKKANALL